MIVEAVTASAHVERDTAEEDAQIVTEPVVENAPVAPETNQESEKLTTPVAETVFWNNTQNNLSVGMAILNKDQLHISLHRTCDLPKDLTPEQAPGLVVIKPGEGMLFNMSNTGPITVA